MKHSGPLLIATLAALVTLAPATGSAARGEFKGKGDLPAIDGFNDSYNHWHNFGGLGNIIKPEAWQKKDRYKPAQYREIAENILLFQNINGGWPKDYDMCARLTGEQKEKLLAAKRTSITSFDNHNIHSQVSFLAKTYTLTNDARHADACLRGLKFILDAQLKSGGWPQVHPHKQKNRDDYRGHITYNDGITMGCLNVLRDAALGQNGFKWLDDPSRKIASDAVNRGIQCILDTQYVNKKGVLTAWGQQHYADNLKPAPARGFELASLTPQDSSKIITFLMLIDNPPEPIQRSIVAATEWIKKVRLTGIRVEVFTSTKRTDMEKDKRDPTNDKRVIEDPGAKPIWARQYDREKDIPVFANDDAVPIYDFNKMDRKSRNRTPHFGNYGDNLLNELYPAWLEKNPSAQKHIPDYRNK
jgi:PelA/Pel-15E family pectate lyase